MELGLDKEWAISAHLNVEGTFFLVGFESEGVVDGFAVESLELLPNDCRRHVDVVIRLVVETVERVILEFGTDEQFHVLTITTRVALLISGAGRSLLRPVLLQPVNEALASQLD